jgi:hypothetical protein
MRLLLIAILLLVPSTSFAQQGKLKPYQFRVKTQKKSVVNTNIRARDQYEAQYKLNKRYPNSTILNLKPGYDRAIVKKRKR